MSGKSFMGEPHQEGDRRNSVKKNTKYLELNKRKVFSWQLFSGCSFPEKQKSKKSQRRSFDKAPFQGQVLQLHFHQRMIKLFWDVLRREWAALTVATFVQTGRQWWQCLKRIKSLISRQTRLCVMTLGHIIFCSSSEGRELLRWCLFSSLFLLFCMITGSLTSLWICAAPGPNTALG